MGDYEVGDWLINKHTKQIVRIIALTPHLTINPTEFVYKIDTDQRLSTSEIDKYYNRLDPNCPVAQVLYTSSSNKAVTNETDEE